MTKEELLQIITPLIGRTNLTERYLSEFADGIAPMVPDGSKAGSDAINGVLLALKSSSGMLSHGIADELKRRSQNPPEPKPAPSPAPVPIPPKPAEPKNGPGEELNEFQKRLAALEKLNKELSDRIVKEDTEKASAQYWNTLKEKVTGKVKVNDYLASQAFKELNPDITKPVDDTVVDAFIKQYDGISEKAGVPKAAPVTPNPAAGGGGGNPFSAFMKKKCPEDFKDTKKE